MNPSVYSNYRLILNPNFLSKTLEPLFLKQVQFHYESELLSTPIRTAFKYTSTEFALTAIIDDVLTSINHKCINVLALLVI